MIEITTTEVGADIAFKLVSRLLADDVDGAADGVLAEQRALGPAQDLDALGLAEIRVGGKLLAHVNAVDIDIDVLLEPELSRIDLGIEATDRDIHGDFIDAVAENEIGHQAGNVPEVDGARVGDVVAGNDRQGDGHVLHGLVATGGRNDDFFQHSGFGLGLRQYRLGGPKHGDRRGDCKA